VVTEPGTAEAVVPGGFRGDVPVDLRCSVIVVRGAGVLLIHRAGPGRDDWVLPGGRPRPGETTAACVRREVREETGLDVEPQRCALVLEVIDPATGERTVDLVFIGAPIGHRDLVGEPGNTPIWVPLARIRDLELRPPIGGYLPGVVNGSRGTAAYLGNMWRPDRRSAPETFVDEAW
jgi:8-oxo-dGTP diphosphatase